MASNIRSVQQTLSSYGISYTAGGGLEAATRAVTSLRTLLDANPGQPIPEKLKTAIQTLAADLASIVPQEMRKLQQDYPRLFEQASAPLGQRHASSPADHVLTPGDGSKSAAMASVDASLTDSLFAGERPAKPVAAPRPGYLIAPGKEGHMEPPANYQPPAGFHVISYHGGRMVVSDAPKRPAPVLFTLNTRMEGKAPTDFLPPEGHFLVEDRSAAHGEGYTVVPAQRDNTSMADLSQLVVDRASITQIRSSTGALIPVVRRPAPPPPNSDSGISVGSLLAEAVIADPIGRLFLAAESKPIAQREAAKTIAVLVQHIAGAQSAPGNQKLGLFREAGSTGMLNRFVSSTGVFNETLRETKGFFKKGINPSPMSEIIASKLGGEQSPSLIDTAALIKRLAVPAGLHITCSKEATKDGVNGVDLGEIKAGQGKVYAYAPDEFSQAFLATFIQTVTRDGMGTVAALTVGTASIFHD